jgi:hypothetical protein
LSVLLSVSAVLLSLAACASSASNTADQAASSKYVKAIGFARCMRSHGVPDFPDPSSGGFQLNTKNDVPRVNGVQLNAGAFQSGIHACGSPYASQSQPPSATQRRAAVQHSDCMRSHGVPNFPDPTFNGNHIEISAPGVNPNSPAYKAAAASCGSALVGKVK